MLIVANDSVPDLFQRDEMQLLERVPFRRLRVAARTELTLNPNFSKWKRTREPSEGTDRGTEAQGTLGRWQLLSLGTPRMSNCSTTLSEVRGEYLRKLSSKLR